MQKFNHLWSNDYEPKLEINNLVFVIIERTGGYTLVEQKPIQDNFIWCYIGKNCQYYDENRHDWALEDLIFDPMNYKSIQHLMDDVKNLFNRYWHVKNMQ